MTDNRLGREGESDPQIAAELARTNSSVRAIFGKVPLMVNIDKRLSLNDLRVYVALSSIQGNRGDFKASRKRIAERSGIHISHISKHTTRLSILGYLGIVRRGKGLVNGYSICNEMNWVPERRKQHSSFPAHSRRARGASSR